MRPDFIAFKTPLWKRIFDLLVACIALLVLLPFLLLIALCIRLESKGAIIYSSKRVGKNYQVFDFLKFRSMYTNADKRLKELSTLNQYSSDTKNNLETIPLDQLLKKQQPEAVLLISDECTIVEESYRTQKSAEQGNTFVKLENDPRVTRMGQFMRKYSIDELPQLLNIIKGDMSIVGNRPLPLYEAEMLTQDNYIDRFMAPAGLTGLWQVEKRGDAGKLSAEERKQLDIRYGKEFSFALDTRILIKTFTAFIQKENV